MNVSLYVERGFLLPPRSPLRRGLGGGRRAVRAVAVGIGAREGRPEEEDLCGIIRPDEEDGERAGRTVGAADAAAAQVQANQVLAEAEQRRGHEAADPHVAPADGGI